MENTSAELCETHSLASSSPGPSFDDVADYFNPQQQPICWTRKTQEPSSTQRTRKQRIHPYHDRSQKLKDARGEAAKEIETLKSKREDEFKEFEQQHSGNTDSQQKVLEEETKQKIEVIKSEFNKNKAQVVSDLLSKVTDVQPELHRNYKLGIHQLK
ncbi:H(+)-transporting V1 sector ATPase subunit G [Puccinia graminis f. sp. tritici]|uniref:V-type proton ATPase subunit G n=1 Tax=Puccinia graminis f. sp. tritici TaxID=56615 RepID=A0A5B0R020_PUCGR|nr:H(+)-transporting V1 sector ATPase subunit G [Puccinia graminis f. sp. tritici]